MEVLLRADILQLMKIAKQITDVNPKHNSYSYHELLMIVTMGIKLENYVISYIDPELLKHAGRGFDGEIQTT